MLFIRTIVVFFAFSMLILVHINAASAQTITTLQPLNFGEAVIRDNTSQHAITVGADGSYAADATFSFVTLPVEGVYQITGAGSNQTISSINVTVDTHPNSSGQTFVLDNFVVDAPAQVDASGAATFSIGARLQTSGIGSGYGFSTVYNGSLDVEVNFL